MPAAIPTPSINISPLHGNHPGLGTNSPQFSEINHSTLPDPYSTLLDSYSSSPSRGDVYERDLEANYCKNFSCCGLTLGDLHALLQHYEEAHVRFEEDEDEDLLVAGAFTDDDGWSTHSESAPNSPPTGASRQLNGAFNSTSAASAAAATVAALTAACAKNTSLSFAGSKKKSNGVSLSDIYSEDSVFIPDEALSAFPNSILRTTPLVNQTNHTKKRDLATFSSSFDIQSPLSKKISTLHSKTLSSNAAAAAALTAASLVGDIQPSSKIASTEGSSSILPGAQDELMSTVTGYLEQAIQRGLLPSCGEVGSPAYLLAVEDLLRKRDEIVSMMESIGRPGSSGADKPYRCTVNGCDKAYKNPNGLKYHNQHGHCSMPGSGEDDKSNTKPYRCTFLDCGKCYKNLNGLKYHIEHSHPNLAAALYANIPGFANLEGANASQAAITAAAAIAAVKGDTVMMSAINAIIASAANNGNRPGSATTEHTPDSSPNSSPLLRPVGLSGTMGTFRGAENPFSTNVTPMTSPLLGRAALSIQTTIGGTKDSPMKLAGLMTPSSLSPTLTTPRSPNGVSTLTAALAAVAVEQRQ
ncbi:hypothetical protein BGZ58_004844 [Dissophora ornata]|nr:hypothetical protein BGZ58_004844 [Dissophora ornata]